MNRELRVAALNHEPVDGTGVHNSADFTPVFAHCRHIHYPRCRFATVLKSGFDKRLPTVGRLFYCCQPPPRAL